MDFDEYRMRGKYNLYNNNNNLVYYCISKYYKLIFHTTIGTYIIHIILVRLLQKYCIVISFNIYTHIFLTIDEITADLIAGKFKIYQLLLY